MLSAARPQQLSQLNYKCTCLLCFPCLPRPVSDITAGKHKTIVVTLHETFWSVGVILLPGVAGLLDTWSYMYVAISMPTLLLVFLYR